MEAVGHVTVDGVDLNAQVAIMQAQVDSLFPTPPPSPPSPVHPSDDEAVGWCGIGFSSQEAAAGTIGSDSTYPACLYECGDNPECAAVRWIVATSVCSLSLIHI